MGAANDLGQQSSCTLKILELTLLDPVSALYFTPTD